MCLDLKCKYADFPLGFQKKKEQKLGQLPRLWTITGYTEALNITMKLSETAAK